MTTQFKKSYPTVSGLQFQHPALTRTFHIPSAMSGLWVRVVLAVRVKESDSSYFPVSPSLVSGDLSGVADWYKASGNSKFQTWIMYNPNIQSTSDIWVPLSSFDLNWKNTATLNTSTHMWQAGAFTSDSGSDIGQTGMWPLWQTWIPYTQINNVNTGTVEMHY